MIHFQRPAEPDGFRERARDARLAVEQAVRAGDVPTFDETVWQACKPVFAEAQRGKCAYCESSLHTHDSHVDHFAPKAEVWELGPSPAERGHEPWPGLPNVRDRKPASKHAPGYWWLAYEWQNFLVLCAVCNTKWKQCYFPVDATSRRLPPDPDVPEPPLLLNPFNNQEPWRHFFFTEQGKIKPADGSKHGESTIATCGLGRESLRLRREATARDAYRYARTFVRDALLTHARQPTP